MSGLCHFDIRLNQRDILVINVHPSLNVNKTPLVTVTLLLHAKNCRIDFSDHSRKSSILIEQSPWILFNQLDTLSRIIFIHFCQDQPNANYRKLF
jgi:hypothetical protein